MYQAIVFLPLLGCVLAGLIALVGARGRCPGGLPEHGSAGPDDPGPHGTGAPSTIGNVAVIHGPSHEPEEHAPSAAGSRSAELITTTLLFVSMVLSWIAFVQVGFG